jgi:hypothetical protein
MTLTVNPLCRKKTKMTDINGRLRKAQECVHPRRRHMCSMTRDVSVIKAKYSDTDAKRQYINEALNDKTLLAGLNRHVHISEVNMASLHATVRKGGVDVPTLARSLGISIEVAKRVCDVTTQRGWKSMIYPSLNLQRSMNDRYMRSRRLL